MGYHKNIILVNGNVLTLDPDQPVADWIIINKNRIYTVGKGNEWRSLGSERDEIIDCKNNTVLPGFIDAHMHLYSYAERMVTLDLSENNGIRSIKNIQNIIKKYSKDISEGHWIRGKGYNEYSLYEKRHPNRWDLDKAVPYLPVKITHRSSHAHVLNSMALKLAGISRETPDPPGGIIDRDLDTGEPTGLLYEMADYLSRQIPPLDQDQLKKGIVSANKELISKGITSIQDASAHNHSGQWELFECWKEASTLKPRVSFMLGYRAFSEYGKSRFTSKLAEEELRLNGVKIILDETTGRLLPEPEELDQIISKVHNSGLQVVIHAIEENAIESAYRSINYILKSVPRKDHRHRIEHCSVCTPSMARQIALDNMMVVTHPEFIYRSGDRYLETVPEEKQKHLYAINTLIKSGIIVAAGSDCPVITPNPLVGIYSAISRLTEKGKVININEGISLHEALKLYTINAAKSSCEEKIKGSIARGKLADLIILEKNIMRMPVDELKEIKVMMTIINGEVVLDRME